MTFSEKLVSYLKNDLFKYLGETLEMVAITALIALIFGLALGLLMYFTRKSKKLWVNRLYKVLDVIVSIFRSFPFYVLMFFVIPFTRIVMQGITGNAEAFSTEAFIVPLSLAAIPFFAKLIENALIEINDGVVEAAVSLGLSKSRIIFKVVLKEALPAIISGVTLGIVTLVGYSAMAGAVGGGGLGFFAYDKGFVSYDFEMMLFAVITIILLVLLIQFLGNLLYKLARKGKIDFRVVGSILGALLIVLTSFIISNRVSASANTKITFGTMSQPGEPILEAMKEDIEAKGYTVEIKIYNEFDALNHALVDGSIDVNLFQHEPYLLSYNKQHNASLYNALTMYDCLYAGYTKKVIKISDLKSKGKLKKIAVANDSSNLKRCLELLAAEGLITLNLPDGNLSASDIKNYYETSYAIEIVPMATASIAQSLDDSDIYMGIVNATFAINAGLGKDLMICSEKDLEHKNANILAIREENKDSIWVKDIVEVLSSNKCKNFILNEFDGVISPYFISHI